MGSLCPLKTLGVPNSFLPHEFDPFVFKSGVEGLPPDFEHMLGVNPTQQVIESHVDGDMEHEEREADTIDLNC